ncbi:MAG TPA: hypothetical protein VM262_06790 [Acidimicrobiales bacterium]|nr:hypothetical protein [Acidimicrobiales bacterium]
MTTLSVHPDELEAERSDQSENRTAELGEYTVDFGTIRAGLIMNAATFKGLPDDACQCPHWGLLLKGEWGVPMSDGTELTIRAGEAYYLPPGHRFEVVTDSEYVEFSPTEDLQKTYAVVAANQAASTDH